MSRAAVSTDVHPGAGPDSIRYHYDVSNEFFFLWLGATQTYSSAMWDGAADASLDAAQNRKLDYLIEGARAPGARRVLDVGCGWGSALRRLVTDHGVGQAFGITLSQAQVDHIGSWQDPRIQAEVEDWSDHEPRSSYDAVISIGAIEHFVKLGSDPERRMDVYGDFFARCRSWLRPGGRLALQTIAKGDARMDSAGIRDLRLIVKEVFPNIDAPWLAELAKASEGRFEILSLRNDRLDYARTLLEWRDRLRAHRERAIELAGEQTVERHERFFPASARHFALGQANLLRMVFQAV